MYVAFCAALGSRTVRLVVDGERMGLAGNGRTLVLGTPPPSPTVCLETDTACIETLLSGEESLLSSARAGRLHMAGAVTDLIAFHEALVGYLHGTVRSPSMPDVLRRFRQRFRENETREGRCHEQ